MNAFPAVHLRKMDSLDITLKFSSELLVIGLTLTVGLLNILFFKFGTGKAYTDNSHAFKLLSYHTALNPKYYAKETSISTVMVAKSGFIAQAQADDFSILTSEGLPENQTDSLIEDGAIVKPNPDSIGMLIEKQVKIYETKSGDTLKSIATAHGITVQTLIDANKIAAGTAIKPGWQLIILPIDGVIYTATPNDTLPDVAKKFSGNIETIISYNGLGGAEDIEGGQIIIVPGGHMPLPVVKPVVPKVTNDGKIKPKGVTTPANVDNGTGHIFPWGYCTWYVASQVHVPWGGNAKNWLANARGYGAVVTNEPTVGAIVVTNDDARYGHVALVMSVDANGFTVNEMNYEKFGKVSSRWISKTSKSIKGFILP